MLGHSSILTILALVFLVYLTGQRRGNNIELNGNLGGMSLFLKVNHEGVGVVNVGLT